MKNIFLLGLTAISLSACATGGNPRTELQDLEASPCACFDYEIFNGGIYKVKKVA